MKKYYRQLGHALSEAPETVQFGPAERLFGFSCRLANSGTPLAEGALLDLAFEDEDAIVGRVIFDCAVVVQWTQPLGF